MVTATTCRAERGAAIHKVTENSHDVAENSGRPFSAPGHESPCVQCVGQADSDKLSALFNPQIEQLGAVPARASDHGRQGQLWLLEAERGKGFYWYFSLDSSMAVGALDLELHQDGGFFCDAPDCFYFGSYSKTMMPYLGIDDGRPDRTVVGTAWRRGPYRQRVPKNVRLQEAFIALLPSGVRDVSLRLHCDPVVLSSAISALDGLSCPADLPSLLDDMRRARPSAVTAEAYYKSKIVEACALIVDWRLSHARCARLTDADIKILATAQHFIQCELHRFVTTEELCSACHLSSSKLIGLFKDSCGMTPQEYIRNLRMERACELLDNTDLSLADVAARLGYARQGSFSEAFRAHCGMTPRAWRSERRGRVDA